MPDEGASDVLVELFELLDDLELLEELPGIREITELCRNPTFRLLCRMCQRLFPKEPEFTLADIVGIDPFDADELGLTEDL